MSVSEHSVDIESRISANEQKGLLNSMSIVENNALFDADGVPKKDDPFMYSLLLKY